MFTSKAKAKADRSSNLIRLLTILLIICLVVIMHAHWLIANVPSSFSSYTPPSLSEGGTTEINNPPRHWVYAFGHRLLQKIKTCEEDCSKDEVNNPKRFTHYLKNSKRLSLEKVALESVNRKKGVVRFVQEYLQSPYKENKVVPLGNGTWKVFIDLHERDYFSGVNVRNEVVRYAFYVHWHDIDLSLNPWKMAIGDDINKPTVQLTLELEK